MWDKPPIEEDAPVDSSLRRSSQKAACEATSDIRSLVEEGVQNKSSQQHGAHKNAVGSPQLLEPSTSDPNVCPSARNRKF